MSGDTRWVDTRVTPIIWRSCDDQLGCPRHGHLDREYCRAHDDDQAEGYHGEYPAVDTTERHVVATAADTLPMRPAKWLWERRIPAGCITLLAGREGIGKSTITADLVARTTKGELPGKFEGEPRSVGIVAAEDAWPEVINPRLAAAGADRSRVYRIEARAEGRYDTVSMPADVERLVDLCRRQQIALLVIDPFMSVIHSGLDTHKDRDVHRALDPLVKLTAEHGVSILALIHVNKSGSSDALNSVMASRAFTAVARSVLYAVVDSGDDNEDRYLLGHAKSNLGPAQPMLAYRITSTAIELDDEERTLIPTSRVSWEGEDQRTLTEALQGAPKERAAGELATSIEKLLADRGRTVALAEIKDAFPDVSEKTLSSCLVRMVKRGKITRPVHGHYALPAAAPGDPAANPAPPLETNEVQEVQETQDCKIKPAVPAVPAGAGTQERVQESVQDDAPSPDDYAWADTIYDRE